MRGGTAKAAVVDPRRAMGELLGNAVRLGAPQDVLAAGEGIETMLSLKSILPDLPVAAALSATQLAALVLPATLRRLYVAVDNDAAGHHAASCLADRARGAAIEARLLIAHADDWNTDLCALGPQQIFAHLAVRLAPEDAKRFSGRSPSQT